MSGYGELVGWRLLESIYQDRDRTSIWTWFEHVVYAINLNYNMSTWHKWSRWNLRREHVSRIEAPPLLFPQHDRIRGTLHSIANIRKRAHKLLGTFKRTGVDLQSATTTSVNDGGRY